MQEDLLKDLQERMTTAMDPEAMLKTWLPTPLKGFEQLQEMLLSQLAPGKRADK